MPNTFGLQPAPTIPDHLPPIHNPALPALPALKGLDNKARGKRAPERSPGNPPPLPSQLSAQIHLIGTSISG